MRSALLSPLLLIAFLAQVLSAISCFGLIIQLFHATWSWARSGNFSSWSFSETFPYLADQLYGMAKAVLPELNLLTVSGVWVFVPAVLFFGIVAALVGGLHYALGGQV